MAAKIPIPTILYIGNRLSRHGLTPTSIETLGPLLESRYRVRYASSRVAPAARFADMIWTTIRSRKEVGAALIDTYSGRAYYYAVSVAFVARRLKLPYIPILRGGDLTERFRHSPRSARQLLSGSFCNVAPSSYLLEAAERLGFAARHIPNSIELNRYVYRPRSAPRPRLLFVRALHPDYNPEMAIRVLATLSPVHPDAELCVVGPDKAAMLDRLEYLASSLGVADRVSFPGYLTKDQWIARSARYDIFLNTTNFDNHPVSLIEAMALGLPVISTEVGGVPALVTDGEHGLLVEKGNVAAMAAAVTTLIEQPNRAVSMARNARRRVENYDWQTVKKQWFDLIDRAVSLHEFGRGRAGDPESEDDLHRARGEKPRPSAAAGEKEN